MVYLLAHGSRPMFDRISANLVAIIDAGWDPPQRRDDPVQWRRCERNKIADFLVNYTMDISQDWSKEFDWPFPGTSLDDCALLAHSDGGTRAHRCPASAWVVEVGRYQN